MEHDDGPNCPPETKPWPPRLTTLRFPRRPIPWLMPGAKQPIQDKLLRTLAEMENLRKRTEREVLDARLYGITGFARDVLAVADNMHRALEAIGPELRQAADAKVKAFIEGVELTERELLKTLEKNGVKKFSPQGERFDPNVHQAMYEVPTSDQCAGAGRPRYPGRLYDR